MGKLIDMENFKKPFEIKLKDNSNAEIIIYQDIGEGGFFYDSLSAKDFDKELKDLPKSVRNIDVRINSNGGDVFDGITIYNRLKNHKAKKTVYIDGLAASIASVIAMAGDEVVMSEGSMIMIHSAWTVAMGNAKDLMNTIDLLEEIDEQILSIYLRKTKMERNEIKKMVSEETWMNADEALEFGFADKKAEGESMPIAASALSKNWMKSLPKVKSKDELIHEKLGELTSNVKDYVARKK